MRTPFHKNPGETAAFVQNMLDKSGEPGNYYWCVELKATGEPIGVIGLIMLDAESETATFAYSLGTAFWGRGYATEAVREVVRFGLNNAGYNRLEAYHSVKNPASGAVMKKAGLKYEGHARQKYKSSAGFEDCDMYAIVKSDFGKL